MTLLDEAEELYKYLPPEKQREYDSLLVKQEERPAVTFADLKIRTKEKRLLPFIPNSVQSRYLDILCPEWRPDDWHIHLQAQAEMEAIRLHPKHEGNVTQIPHYKPIVLRGIREDILKARQQGFSTLWLALYFLDTINNPLTESHVYAHDGETTEKLFRVVHRFYENLPSEKKRPKRFSNRREIVFADTESGIFVGMVGGSALGRGGTVNNAHLSERAWNTNYAELEVGLLQAIPEGGNVTRETTANGFNEYYEERQRGHRGESRFKPRFFGWNLHSEYRLSVGKSENAGGIGARTQRQESAGMGGNGGSLALVGEEQSLCEAYGLDAEQLLWRREKMKDLKEKFPQEYPLTEREAFLSSGNPIFDRNALEVMEARLQGVQALPQPSLCTYDTAGRRIVLPRLRAVHGEGQLSVFEEPDEYTFYLVSADPASGANKEGDLDDCSASVWGFSHFSPFRPLEQVAHLYGRWEPHEFAWLCADLAYYYHEAMINVLSMNHGHAVLTTLVNEIGYAQNRGDGWGGIYYHDPSDLTQRGNDTDPDTRLPGWPETPGMSGGKAFAVASAQQLVSQGEVILNSRLTVTQCFQYVYLNGGGMGGEAGHDDAVSDFYCAAATYRLRGHRAKLTDLKRRQREVWTPPKPAGSGAFQPRRG